MSSPEPERQTTRPPSASAEDLRAILNFDTCTISNAIEQFGIRLRNEGFTRPGLSCMTGGSPRVLGYAATCRVRASDPPMTGDRFVERTDWWEALEALPLPRIAVIQDLEPDSGRPATVGQVHVAILKAFQCTGIVTNGAVRNLPAVRAMEVPVFARFAAVSHSYTHLVDFGGPAEILGLSIKPGDLVYADCHGAISIPHEIARIVADAAASIREHERQVIDICESPHFSEEELLEAIRRIR